MNGSLALYKKISRRSSKRAKGSREKNEDKSRQIRYMGQIATDIYIRDAFFRFNFMFSLTKRDITALWLIAYLCPFISFLHFCGWHSLSTHVFIHETLHSDLCRLVCARLQGRRSHSLVRQFCVCYAR